MHNSLICICFGRCDRLLLHGTSSCHRFVAGPRCPTLKVVFWFWIGATFYTLLILLSDNSELLRPLTLRYAIVFCCTSSVTFFRKFLPFKGYSRVNCPLCQLETVLGVA
jgi:hypothetical protein